MGIYKTDVKRVEGKDKLTGKSKFIDDYRFPNMLYGVTVRSSVSRGVLKRIDFGSDIDWDEYTIVTSKDIIGSNFIPMLLNDCPFLVEREINYIGEPVALIAHKDPVKAHEALNHINLVVEELQGVFSIEDSLDKKNVVWGVDNILAQFLVEKGNVESVWDQAEYIVTGEYRTAAQEQLYIENNGMIANFDSHSGVTVWGSMQCPYYIHSGLMNLFGYPKEKIRIIQTETGGAFGGKEDFPTLLAGHAALLAMKAKMPVKMIYDRAEDMAVTTKRHPSRTIHRTAVDKSGKILGMDIDFVLDGGAYATLSSVVLSRGCIHAAGPYKCDNTKIRARAVATNSPPNGAFRGFGAPQSVFALERHMDKVAKTVGLTPEKFREINFVKEGDALATGQVVREKVDFKGMLEKAFEEVNYFEKKKIFAELNENNPVKKGIGFSTFMHGAGFTGSGESKMASIAGLEFTPNGKVKVLAASTEMGQGRNTVFTKIVCDFLNINPDDVITPNPDTATHPNSGPTVASRTTMVVGKLIENAAIGMRNILISSGLLKENFNRENFFEAAREFLSMYGDLKTYAQYEHPKEIIWDEKTYKGDAYATYAWAVYLAEVSVDTRTYEIKVDNFFALQEVGKVVDMTMAKGQIQGGVAQGIGYALYEDVKFDNGIMINNRMTNYIMPTSMDLPDIHVEFLEWNRKYGPEGAKGIGELPMDGSAPAVVNAVCNAVEANCEQIPVLPEELLRCMEGSDE